MTPWTLIALWLAYQPKEQRDAIVAATSLDTLLQLRRGIKDGLRWAYQK